MWMEDEIDLIQIHWFEIFIVFLLIIAFTFIDRKICDVINRST